MTIYKLKKDWSSFKAGDRFKLSDYGNGDLYQLVNDDDKLVLAKMPTDLLDTVGSSNCWKPMNGEKFYYIDEDGDVFDSVFGPGESPLNMGVYLLGNCFRTREDAQAVVDWLRARQRLIKSGARFINSRGIDTDRECFIVYFNVDKGKLVIEDTPLNEHSVYQKRMYFDNRQLARKSIEEHRDDWLTYLGVKEKNDERTDV